MVRRGAVVLIGCAVLAAACGGGGESASDPTPEATEPAETTTPAATAVPEPSDSGAPTETPTVPPPGEPIVEYVLVPDGPEELVFDWSEDRCADLALPDIATRVLRKPDGMLELYISNLETFPMVGPDFDSLEIDCSQPLMTPDYDPDPSQFNDAEWLASLYPVDDDTIYAIVHNEYLGQSHPGQCLDNTFFNCIDTSLTLAVSTNGGETYRDAVEPPGHLIASMPYRFDENGLPTGIWQPSNIIEGGDGYLYMLANVSTYPTGPDVTTLNWICAMRTDDITDPASWRYWDGNAFDGVFINPYVEDPGPVESAETCAPVDFPALSGELSESIVWSDTLQSYIIAGGTHEPGEIDNRAVYYSTSTDLIDWTPRRRLIDLPVPGDITLADTMTFVAYPTLLDHDSDSPTFATVDDEFHLYVVLLNEGTSSLDRDLVRYPIRIEAVEVPPSQWTFDEDPGGWAPDFDIEEFAVVDGALTVTAGGSDPYFSVTGVRIPEEYSRLTVTMAVDGRSDFAQLFFLPDDADWFGDDTQVGFDVVGGGEMVTYTIDLSTAPGWAGDVTALRFDPVTTVGSTVRIDSITIGP